MDGGQVIFPSAVGRWMCAHFLLFDGPGIRWMEERREVKEEKGILGSSMSKLADE